MGILSWNFISQWGSCTWAKYPLVHSPTIQQSTVESTLKEFPSMPKLSSAWQTHGGTNVEHTEYDMETDTQTNPCIPDAGWTGIY